MPTYGNKNFRNIGTGGTNIYQRTSSGTRSLIGGSGSRLKHSAGFSNPGNNVYDVYDTFTGLKFHFVPGIMVSSGSGFGTGSTGGIDYSARPLTFTTNPRNFYFTGTGAPGWIQATSFINACYGTPVDANYYSYNATANPVCFAATIRSAPYVQYVNANTNGHANSFWTITGLDPSTTVPEGIPGCDEYNNTLKPTTLNTGGSRFLNYMSLDRKLYVMDAYDVNQLFVYSIVARDLEQTLDQFFPIS